MEHTFSVKNAAETKALGRALARYVRAGDLVMLNGNLGAGKTTFTQGLGAGMNVRGQVSSPTFIVARVHPPLQEGGVPLIHADAYRITDTTDLETLDLESSLDQAVTVIEWGEGKTEGLSEDRLEIFVKRPEGDLALPAPGQVVDLTNVDDGCREITMIGHGVRWAAFDFAVLERK
ncbi:MAG: tRNA (adenosine(37)-N6)-threonylcarbamoyltransferase complex ATPase subunit type 1 TsaE [Actinomycetaceae bacterium]|nr:tRNA (adenosine(37)-N6)-threonylcarbamoyltransferase complex ATPase subunit type 1 TsaE [Actinomycetaceae bacterium]